MVRLVRMLRKCNVDMTHTPSWSKLLLKESRDAILLDVVKRLAS